MDVRFQRSALPPRQETYSSSPPLNDWIGGTNSVYTSSSFAIPSGDRSGRSNDSEDKGYYSLSDSDTPPIMSIETPYGDNTNPNDSYYDKQYNRYGTSQPSRGDEYRLDEMCKETPTTLGWLSDDKWLKYYTFTVKKGLEPHFVLQPGLNTPNLMPQVVYLDPPSRYLPKGDYPCQFPSCPTKKIFNRPADLDRHYKNVHAPDEKKEEFQCDYPKCDRSGEPFTRKDHCRDHLRDYHKEDIGQAKRTKKDDKSIWERAQMQWLKARMINSKWWRCSKCLKRVQVDTDGWECRGCNVACESERKEARRKRKVEDQTTTDFAPFSPACSTCNGTAWIDNRNDGWALCPNCSPATSTEAWEYENYTCSVY